MAQSKTSLRSSLAKGRELDVVNAKDYALGRYHPGTGYDWCARRERRKAGHLKGHTPGRTKGDNCVADAKKRHMAKSSRSYKHRNYGNWLAWCSAQR